MQRILTNQKGETVFSANQSQSGLVDVSFPALGNCCLCFLRALTPIDWLIVVLTADNGSLTFKGTTHALNLRKDHPSPGTCSSNFFLFLFLQFSIFYTSTIACLVRARVIAGREFSWSSATRAAKREAVPARVFSLSHRSNSYLSRRSLLLHARLPRRLQVQPLTYFKVGSSQGGTSEKTWKNHVNWNP